MYQQYNYTFHELRMQLENQVVQIQIQYHKAFQIIWETVVMISGVSYQYQKPLTIYLQTKSFTKNTTLLRNKYHRISHQRTKITIPIPFVMW